MATIAQNLAALRQAKTDIASAITTKGGTVAQGDGLSDFAADIGTIPSGVDTSNDTVTPATLAEGATAHNAAGEQITGTMQGGLDVNIKFSGDSNIIPDNALKSAKFSGAIVISDRILSIGDSAFYSCSGLTSVTIGNSVTTIGGSAFTLCISLTSITIPSSVTTIGAFAFYLCTSLTSITIPSSVTTIGGDAFSGCSNLTTITIDKPQDSVSGAPWGATNATVVWTG